jgi:glycerate dehydrogenase
MKFIGVLATGYNVVDYEYAREKSVLVTNVPTYGTDSVSQFAIAFCLEICPTDIGYHDKVVHDGKWSAVRIGASGIIP